MLYGSSGEAANSGTDCDVNTCTATLLNCVYTTVLSTCPLCSVHSLMGILYCEHCTKHHLYSVLHTGNHNRGIYAQYLQGADILFTNSSLTTYTSPSSLTTSTSAGIPLPAPLPGPRASLRPLPWPGRPPGRPSLPLLHPAEARQEGRQAQAVPGRAPQAAGLPGPAPALPGQPGGGQGSQPPSQASCRSPPWQWARSATSGLRSVPTLTNTSSTPVC